MVVNDTLPYVSTLTCVDTYCFVSKRVVFQVILLSEFRNQAIKLQCSSMQIIDWR